MRAILAISALIALGTDAVAQDAFPRSFEGLWAERPAACAKLKAGQRSHDRSSGAWLNIKGTAVTGTVEERFVRITEQGSVIILDETWNVQEELTILPDGRLQQTVVGSRAAIRYRRCR